MHARKSQRVNDGYYDKHEGNQYPKYGHKNERRSQHGCNESPGHHYPSSSSQAGPSMVPRHHGYNTHPMRGYHYGHSSSDRPYMPRNPYTHGREERSGYPKERDGRDYKASRESEMYSKSKRNKDNEHREHSSHGEGDEKKNRRDAGGAKSGRGSKYDEAAPTSDNPASEWSTHISSSGKRYYYNSVSEVSQWEKPREWYSKKNIAKQYSSKHHDEKRPESRSRRDHNKYANRSDGYWNSHNGREEVSGERKRSKHPGNYEEGRSGAENLEPPPPRTAPHYSEKTYSSRPSKPAPSATVTSSSEKNIPPVVVLDNSNQPGRSLLAAALPRIISTPVTSTVSSATPKTETTHASTPHRDAGPPTPTHSENTDPHAPPTHLETALPRRMEGLGSYSSVVGNANMQATPMLTPSLINYVREDLTSHVTGWSSSLLERQANKYADEAYQTSCLQLTRVSAQLKCSRSVVRHKEIQATLQEQKLMYLRQQITRLEELKSQNTFMSED